MAFTEVRNVTFGANSFPPFFGEEMPNEGPFIELLRTVFMESNVKVTIDWLPWKRVIRNAKNGSVDGIAFAWRTPERESFLYFDEKFLANENGLYYSLSGKIQISKPFVYSSLNGTSIGVVGGYAMPELLKNSGATFNEGISDATLLRMLLKGRLDFVYTGKYVGQYALASMVSEGTDVSNIKWYVTLESFPNYLAISKAIDINRANEIRRLFKDGLVKIQGDGRYEKILRDGHLIK